MDFDAEFVERRYMKNIEKLRAPGARANIGESIAKKIRTIELLVFEILTAQ